VAGFLKWGDTSNLGQTAQGEVATKSVSAHTITLKGLSKGKSYYFSINSGGTDYKNNGVPWSTTTATSASTNVARISGTVQLSTGAPASEVLIYVDAPNMTQQSTISSTSGNWVLTLPIAETEKTALLDVYVQGGAQGIATAQVYLGSANPIPPMSLGKTYDLRSLNPTSTSGVPDSSVTLPQGSTQSGTTTSRFELSQKATPKPNSPVVVNSVDEGETIFSTKPQFFGDGPANTTITIKLNSTTQLTQTVKTAADGSWAWTVPQNLEEGNHTLTISWKNAQGVVQTIVRSFIVQAQASEPAFVSTPSASSPTPTATPKPTATVKPTVVPTATAAATVTPTPTVKPTATPRPTVAPSTESALPNAGSPLATIMMLSFGAALILGGILVSFRSSE
jgi:hypothetical protein